MSTSDTSPRPRLSTLAGMLIFIGALVGTFILGLLIASVLERRREANTPPRELVQLSAFEPDNAKWGKNFPREYNAWQRTAETTPRTKYGGPPMDYNFLDYDPRLIKLFQGYPFAVEYNEDRGHMHALEDVRATPRRDPERGGKPQPGTCWTCKSSNVPGLMKEMGVGKFYQAHFEELDARMKHPIGCADCHDPETMNLRISRPALVEAMKSQGKDVKQASLQEMRSLVCAQCHVEYYFAKQPGDTKKGTYLTFPWKHGTSVDAIEKYYNETVKHTDWVHPVSKTEMIKMQHPDYEVYKQGVHAYRGVACADCHMPYLSEGGVKYTDHHIQSPLKIIDRSCQVCHRWSEAEIKARVESIQDETNTLLIRTEDVLVQAHEEIGQAMKAGATDAQLAPARRLLRNAQLRWDYVAANNGMGFHAPQETARVLATALDKGQQARLEVAKVRK